MRFKLIDKSVLADKVQEIRGRRDKLKQPYILWGIVKTEWTGKSSGNPVAKQMPRVVTQTSAAGFRVSDIEEYASKGYVLLYYYLPTSQDLPNRRTEGMSSESGWRYQLRTDPSYFSEVRTYCDRLLDEGINPLQNVVDEQAKELEELRALRAKVSKAKNANP